MPGAKYEIDGDRCLYCGSCAPVCPMGAISRSGEGLRDPYVIDPGLCVGCGTCQPMCHYSAVRRKS